MPTISYFYGIAIIMHVRGKEHEPPHIHAITPDFEAAFSIDSAEIIRGKDVFPVKAAKLVKEFVIKNQNALMEMWTTGEYRKLPPIN